MSSCCGNAAGVVDIGNRAAAGVALATPQAHRDTDDIMAGVDQLGRGHRRIDAAAEGDEDLHAASARAQALRRRRRCRRSPRSTSAAVVVRPRVSRNAPAGAFVGTPMAASTCDGSIAPLAHDDAALAHTPASSSRYSNASFSMPSMQTCAEPATLSRRVDGLVHVVELGLRSPSTSGRAARRCATFSSARSVSVARSAVGHRDDSGDVVRAAAPLALLSAAHQQRRERRRRRGPSARRRPSGRRTCVPTATSDRRAG